MSNQYSTPWSAEQDALLVKLWARGLSAGIIEGHFKGVKSRCAVLGRLYRMNKLCGDRITTEDKRFKAEPKAKGKLARRYRKPVKLRVLVPTSRTLLASFAEIDEGACLWPEGDPMQEGFRHCGARKERRKPYCPGHAAVSRR